MVVRQYHGCGVARQGLFDDLARIDRSGIDCAAKQFVEGKYTVAIIEKQAAKYLVRPIPQRGQQVFPAIGRRADQHPWAQPFAQVAAAALACGKQYGRLGIAYPANFCQFTLRSVQNSTQATEAITECPREIERRKARRTLTQQYGEQLGVGQLFGPPRQQALSRPVVGRPLPDRHIFHLAILLLPDPAAKFQKRLLW
jgi:hypothetical protein